MQELKKSVSMIHERARRQLAISRDEYALCDYALYRSADPRQPNSGWCCDRKEDVAEFVGITRPGLYKMMSKMQGLGLLEFQASSGFFRATTRFIDVQEGASGVASGDDLCKQSLQSPDDDCKQSLHARVNKVYTDCKQSLHERVNKVTPQYSCIVRVKEDKEEREGERECAAHPMPPVGETFSFGAKKEKAPPVAPPPPDSGPADCARPEPFSLDWFVDAVEAANHDKSTDDCGFGPLHVTAYGPPTAEVFDAPPGGPTYRAEVHPPAETRAVRPGRAQKPAPAPRAVEVPESHAAVGPYLSQLLAKKHYLRKTPERLAREMAWLFSKPVAFALRHVQDSLGSQRPGGAWDALDFTGCEAAFSRWQQDERIRAQAQGPNTPAQPTHRPAAHQSPVFGERRLTA